ncbi:hypothetical protein [Streptomyces sp. NPDC057545]|uniref:hypothetical protein n=1 Tax=Streptomyces sp. NPDC057545 TaxID=3346164 RepID=UPI0036BAA112
MSDRLDIPVLLRDGPQRRPSRKPWERVEHAWPGVTGIPANGWYLATTTWRQILKAATEVGRDIGPWLALTPNLAINELVSRISPLHAYLRLKKVETTVSGAAGRCLFVNAIHRHGTERSARSAFGYHLGMTMAQWACAGMMGLGPTQHIEAGGPNDHPGFLDASLPLPDLWGSHPVGPLPWLIEAKAHRCIGLPALREGMEQLRGGSALMHGQPHMQVLCGTSLPALQSWEEDRLFMTVDTMHVPGGPTRPGRTTPFPRTWLAAVPKRTSQRTMTRCSLPRSRRCWSTVPLHAEWWRTCASSPSVPPAGRVSTVVLAPFLASKRTKEPSSSVNVSSKTLPQPNSNCAAD